MFKGLNYKTVVQDTTGNGAGKAKSKTPNTKTEKLQKTTKTTKKGVLSKIVRQNKGGSRKA